MNNKRRYRSSLGALRIVQLLATLTVIGGVANVLLFGRVLATATETERTLQNIQIVEYHLLSMQVAERAYILFDAEQHADITETFEQQVANFNDIIVEIAAFDAESAALLSESADVIRNDFDERVAGNNADQTIGEELLRELEIDQQIDDLADAYLARFEETLEFGLERRVLATNIGLVVLMLFPLLALWAFISISKITQPILLLANAASAIGGKRYKAGMLADLRARKNSVGELARSLEQLAGTLAEREQHLREEAEALENQISDVRDRKLAAAKKLEGAQ